MTATARHPMPAGTALREWAIAEFRWQHTFTHDADYEEARAAKLEADAKLLAAIQRDDSVRPGCRCQVFEKSHTIFVCDRCAGSFRLRP